MVTTSAEAIVVSAHIELQQIYRLNINGISQHPVRVHTLYAYM